jgi:hypothetical protein
MSPPSPLMICNICSFHGDDYQECRLLGFYAHTVFLHSMLRLLVTGNVFPSSPIHVTMMMGAILFFEMSVLRRTTKHIIPEDGVLGFKRKLGLFFFPTDHVYYVRICKSVLL